MFMCVSQCLSVAVSECAEPRSVDLISVFVRMLGCLTASVRARNVNVISVCVSVCMHVCVSVFACHTPLRQDTQADGQKFASAAVSGIFLICPFITCQVAFLQRTWAALFLLRKKDMQRQEQRTRAGK